MDFNRIDRTPGFIKGGSGKPEKTSIQVPGKSVQALCQKALTLLANVSLSTQKGEDHCIPQNVSQKFSAIVLKIQKRHQDKEVYTGLVIKILDKIYQDNEKDLLQGLEQLDENDQKERKGKIAMFKERGYKAFTALLGLMNAQGHKKVRLEADGLELDAIKYLNDVRERFTHLRISKQDLVKKDDSVRKKLF